MLLGHNLTRSRGELAANLAAPRPVFKRLRRPGSLLNGSDVLPGLVVAGTVPVMQRVEHAKPCLTRRSQNLRHVRNALVPFRNGLQATPDLPSLGNEIVVGIDHEKGSDLLLVRVKYVTLCFHCLMARVPAVGWSRVGRERVRRWVIVEERVSPPACVVG